MLMSCAAVAIFFLQAPAWVIHTGVGTVVSKEGVLDVSCDKKGDTPTASFAFEKPALSSWRLSFDVAVPKPGDNAAVIMVQAKEGPMARIELGANSFAELGSSEGPTDQKRFPCPTGWARIDLYDVAGLVNLMIDGKHVASADDQNGPKSLGVLYWPASKPSYSQLRIRNVQSATLSMDDINALPSAVPLRPGWDGATPETTISLKGVDPGFAISAVPAGDGRLRVVGPNADVVIQPGSSIQLAPVLDKPGLAIRESGLFVNGKIFEQEDLVALSGIHPYDYNVPELPGTKERINVVCNDEHKQRYDPLKLLLSLDPHAAVSISTSTDKRIATIRADNPAISQLAIFLRGRYMGVMQLKGSVGTVGIDSLPPGSHAFYAIPMDSTGAVYAPVKSSFDVPTRTSFKLADDQKLFEPDGSGSSTSLQVQPVSDLAIAKVKIFLDGAFVADIPGSGGERSIDLDDTPTGAAEIEAQAILLDGTVLAPEVLHIRIKNESADSAMPRARMERALKATYAELSNVDADYAYWHSLGVNTAEYRHVETTDTSMTNFLKLPATLSRLIGM